MATFLIEGPERSVIMSLKLLKSHSKMFVSRIRQPFTVWCPDDIPLISKKTLPSTVAQFVIPGFLYIGVTLKESINEKNLHTLSRT